LKDGGLIGTLILGHIFDRWGWPVCLLGVAAALTAATMLAGAFPDRAETEAR
jgi:MFS transporter, YNFM family, putative membrane transport protein